MIKTREARGNRTAVKNERRLMYEMFSYFHKNASVASKFTNGNSHACIIIMYSKFSFKKVD